MRKQASGKTGSGLFTTESVFGFIKRKIQAQAKLLWRYKKVKMEIADMAFVIIMVMM